MPWKAGEHFENTDAPYIVETHPDGDWQMRLAHKPNSRTIQRFASRDGAVSEAKRLAKRQKRPGVLLRFKDGTFNKFIPNQEWWGRAIGHRS